MQPRKIFGRIKLNATVPGMDDKQQPSEKCWYPSKIEWDLTNEPLSKLLELWDTQV